MREKTDPQIVGLKVLPVYMTFKDAMSLVPTSVSVISCLDGHSIYGCTISSLVSVDISENSPEIMFVLKKNSTIGKKIESLKIYNINLLSADQEYIAKHYSGSRLPDKVGDSNWEIELDQFPTLRNSRVTFKCEFLGKYERHNADIHIGKVLSYQEDQNNNSLIYDSRNFGKFLRN